MNELVPRRLIAGLVFPEGPRWHDERLWFSDMYGNSVQSVTLEGNVKKAAEVSVPSGLGFTRENVLLVVSMGRGCILEVNGQETPVYADLTQHIRVEQNANDAVIDSAGRLYVGNFGFDMGAGEEPQPAKLLMVDTDRSVRVVADDLSFPNGMAITPDDKRLIVAESYANRLTSFDIAGDGSLSNRTVFAAVGEMVPDGICLDSEGGVWFGSFSTGEFVRVLEGGEVTDRIPMPGMLTVACMLGGPERKTLFLLTIAGPYDEDLATGKRRDGSISTVEVTIPGAGRP